MFPSIDIKNFIKENLYRNTITIGPFINVHANFYSSYRKTFGSLSYRDLLTLFWSGVENMNLEKKDCAALLLFSHDNLFALKI